MTELERKIAAKIPGEDTGIEVRRSFCDICAPLNHCGIDAYIKDGKLLKVEGTKDHPFSKGLLCTKGANNRAYIYKEDRLQTPLRRIGSRGSGEFEAISWNEAYDIIAEKLNGVKTQYGADAVAFYSGHTKWYRFLLQRFAHVFGSINYGTESSCCFTGSRLAWLLLGGKYATSDIRKARLYLAWGSPTHYSRYTSANALDDFAARGGTVISVDPRLTPANQRIAALHLRVLPGTDGLLANTIAGIIIRNGWQDREYIEKYVHGFEPYAAYVSSLSVEDCAACTGVPAESIERAADMIAHIKPMACECNPNSLLHQTNGLQTARAIHALTVITGNLDTPGGNVPADFSFCEQIAGFHTGDEEFALGKKPKSFSEAIGGKRFPVWSALIEQFQACDMPRQILEGTPYPIKALFALGLNMRMLPDTAYTKKALEALDFFVDTDLFLTDTAKYADIVLPACSSLEREEFKAYPGGWAAYYLPVIEPLFQSKSDALILQELAVHMGLEDEWLKAGYRSCIRHILEDTDICLDDLLASQLPVRVRNLNPQTLHGYLDGGCHTPSGKLELYSEVIAACDPALGLEPLPVWHPAEPLPNENYPFRLLTGIRISNAMHTRLHNVPWARSLRPVPTADINTEDAAELGIEPEQDVEIYNERGSIRVRANPTAAIGRGQVCMFHGYAEADVSTLLDHDRLDPYSGFPGFKTGICAIRVIASEER